MTATLATAARHTDVRATVADSAPRVGLITPYCGGNLGDAATFESSIRAIRSRFPSARILGMTLWPSNTQAIHDVPCFPIAGFRTDYYSVANVKGNEFEAAEAGAEVENSSDHLRARVKDLVARVPPLHRFIRWVRDAAVLGKAEIEHIAQALKVVRRLDLIVVNGSGQLDDEWGGAWGHPYALFKWATLARMTGTPLVVISTGIGRISTPVSRWFFRRALAAATYRSFRDAKTLSVVEGFRVGEARLVPDLAFGLADTVDTNHRSSAPKTVGVSPIAYLHPEVWPSADVAAYNRYTKVLGEFVTSLVEQGHEVVWFTTSRSDRRVIADVRASLPAEIAEQVPEPATFVQTLPQLFELLGGVDVVVASRLHGVLLSHVLNKPVVALSYDFKVSKHMEDMGQSPYNLDISAATFAEVSEAFRAICEDSDGVRSDLRQVVSANATALRAQMDQVLSYM